MTNLISQPANLFASGSNLKLTCIYYAFALREHARKCSPLLTEELDVFVERHHRLSNRKWNKRVSNWLMTNWACAMVYG